MINTLLVANRGEIACRVFRTCAELGIDTVAVHSDPDADALHTRTADASVRLPGAAPSDTYLRGELVVKAALAAGADAVHPGYGFLSENADFARAVTDAGLTWIGPSPDAIAAMASKTRAKELMAKAGVPLLAPVDPATATDADLPLLLKAAAGGGGRGMRIVRELAQLQDEVTAASAEARSAFGDGDVFAEPYVENGRHIEVQVLADTHGTVWALGTRDCSLQRRHQKVIEEAPAPGLTDAQRTTLHDAATAAARAVGYVGAGTVEFLVDANGRAYFLEMNTRLQVEHPVTEAVFGIDLVALQIRVAEGHALPPTPPDARGHAVEARLYAEDPARGWQPQTGVLHTLDVPTGPGLRLDTGFESGDTVGVHYDPMLAKVIAHAPTRAEAVRALAHTLARTRVHGPVTNRDLLVRSLRHPDFRAARLDTGFYDRHLDALTTPPPGEALAAVAAALADAAARGGRFGGGWRNVPSQPQTKTYNGHEVRYRRERDGGYRVEGVDRVVSVTPHEVVLETEGVQIRHRVQVHASTSTGRSGASTSTGRSGQGTSTVRASTVYVDTPTGSYALTPAPRFPDPTARTAPGSLLAPMPGTVVRIAEGLAEGVRVEAGQPLLWLEAMKMEHRVTAPASGTLTALHAAPGRQVEVGTLLAVVTDTSAQEDQEA
ncbi:biotin carboxylase N-terminal domain-containing protein [Streptomyces finlayi]|uniref:ATP-binding protein n=1 Tax=Streptomyces finlayi TaxID=67296 RepID=UPI001677C306|nr:biotin carboxylase N-terminal domain-containing protein [Streptomyces finlayi]